MPLLTVSPAIRGPPASAAEAKRRCAHVSRLMANLRGHRLVAKVRASRRYRCTPYGIRGMAAALHARHVAFPEGVHLAVQLRT